MTSGINLLPSEFVPKGSVAKIGKSIRRFGFVIIILFFIVASFSGVSIYLLGRRMISSRESTSKLKNELDALRGSEQSLILVQDRVKKIDSVNKKKDAKEEIDILSEMSEVLTDGVIIDSSHLKEDIAEVTFQSSNLTDMTRLINTVGGLGEYKIVTLILFDFTPTKGYMVTLGFSKI
ncbi:MAG: hypothetical protein US60_C0008G0053 [Microgenomates group bacterium GW2011_GWC1_37_8]|uniref:Fimbrial assembly family protein n=1 Tax=Candidatus Woesebacteria bacterium GW2011_GWB1_38_8 TaxID=1618570 RepID=A0A0G0L1N7_9BACT|nr:MAG: hypothetical protein US60_C0008G0053 [Microgenomates group bacterium GW2011_GWC1_37_8]KKQ85888.1 MAG: hypothetical protein UT08_C0003G0051 [Candidatus Woesebacteria bacterium GW2011_GWB1_38_8]